jgi:membrane-bound serine protease (ClpP class)
MMLTVVSLAAAGIALMFLEMFLPGIIAGVVGGILLFASIIVAYRDMGTGAGNLVLIAAVGATAGLWWWWATKFQHTRFGRRMTLTASGTGEAGMGDQLASLHDQIGTALTPLRPSGTISIAGHRVDAITGGEFLDAGTRVRVVRTHGLGVLVRQEI